jgi:rubrerythrin
VLSQVADAEATDEGRIFDEALSHVDDPELQKLIRKHQADELRHAELFLACEARQGLPPRVVPNHLRLLRRIEARLGAPLHKPIHGREDIMKAYLLLQVLEERAMVQFDVFIRAFRDVDPETSAVFEAVKADEARHLKYCHAISRRYAPDEATRLAYLARARVEEAAAYRENQLANMEYTMETGLMKGAARRAFWRALAAFNRGLPVTRFFGETAHLVPATA